MCWNYFCCVLRVVKFARLDQMENELFRNKTKIGVPTICKIHDKFIACGTSLGALILFSHYQELITIIENKTEKVGPVTCIDVNKTGDKMICGFESGTIILVDGNRKYELCFHFKCF